jgi:hypothetical protein
LDRLKDKLVQIKVDMKYFNLELDFEGLRDPNTCEFGHLFICLKKAISHSSLSLSLGSKL